VRDGISYRRASVGHRGSPPRKVISDTHERVRTLQDLHDESGHGECDDTYNKVKNRLYWKGLYTDVNRFVQSCEKCEKRRPHQEKNTLRQIRRRCALTQVRSLLRSLRPVGPKFSCNALYLLTRCHVVLTPCLHLSSGSPHFLLMMAPASPCLFCGP